MKKPAAAAAEAKKKVMKKPAASCDKWASEKDDDAEEEAEEVAMEDGESKDYSTASKIQYHVFNKALQIAPGCRGSLPTAIHDLWKTMASGPGAAKERHALRNACVPKNADYRNVCNADVNGPLMQRIRNVFEIKQRRVQMHGVTESEMLHDSFHGNEGGNAKSHC